VNLVYRKRFHLKILYDESFGDAVSALLQDLETTLGKVKKFVKDQPSDTTTVTLIKIKQQDLIVKRYNFRGFWHFVKLQFRKSHAFRSFHYANLLNFLNIPCIRPVAAIQKKFGVLKAQSYFISEFKAGLPGCIYFDEKLLAEKAWQETVNEIFTIVNKMRKYGIYHGDFHYGNLLIDNNNQPYLVDFDSMKLMNSARFVKFHRKDIDNFNRYLKRNKKAEQLFRSLPGCNCLEFISFLANQS
jgi:thiamine kinase-like enzyme